MRLIVVDASIILKWVLQKETESNFALAYKLLEDFINDKSEIHLPELWKYEVGNILAIKEPKHAPSLIDILMDYAFIEHALDKNDCKKVIGLQNKIGGCTFYDVAYHYLAIKLDATLITADKKYFQKANKHNHIMLLNSG